MHFIGNILWFFFQRKFIICFNEKSSEKKQWTNFVNRKQTEEQIASAQWQPLYGNEIFLHALSIVFSAPIIRKCFLSSFSFNTVKMFLILIYQKEHVASLFWYSLNCVAFSFFSWWYVKYLKAFCPYLLMAIVKITHAFIWYSDDFV